MGLTCASLPRRILSHLRSSPTSLRVGSAPRLAGTTEWPAAPHAASSSHLFASDSSMKCSGDFFPFVFSLVLF